MVDDSCHNMRGVQEEKSKCNFTWWVFIIIVIVVII